MAVAMETTAWRGSELPVKTKSHSTAWGADAQKLMQMMMGQLHSAEPPAALVSAQLSTLDLFGQADPPSSQLTSSSSPEFLELEPEEPLPSGWEKCLDLKSGKLYYVEKSSGVSTFNDPRKRLQTLTNQLSPHEFLGSKRSETLSLKASSSSSSETPRKRSSSLDLFQKPHWKLQLDVTLASSCEEQELEEDSNVELDLNLAAGGSSSSPSSRRQTVCTMEMIKNALRRTENQLSSSPNVVVQRHKLSTVSSSFSSLTSPRSDPVDSCVAPSPSTSSSSSTSSRSRRASKVEQSTLKSRPASTGVCEDDSNVALVMGACTRCLMYVMLKKIDPRCPRCESEVPVDFSGPPCKRQRVESERR